MPESSSKTRVVDDDHAAPAPTVMAYGLGNAKYTQVYIEGPEMPRLPNDTHCPWAIQSQESEIDTDSPSPTIMSNGRGQSGFYFRDPAMPRKSSASDKPPYRVPLMTEIAEIKPNGFTAISTFSGCGGSSLGYRMAGFKLLWANEFVEAARESYIANRSRSTIVDGRDIREVQPQDVLDAIRLKKGELDLLDGSPPCASFSTAGKRQEHWGKVKKYSDREQRTDDLFFEYIRLLEGIKPKTFVAENVSGLVKGTAKGYFLEILAKMKAAGYRVAARVLDAQWLGVPQCRQRTIFVGVRNDLKGPDGKLLMPAHPTPLPYRYSVREAIPWIVRVGKVPGGDFDKKGRGRLCPEATEPSPTIIAGLDRVPHVEADARMDNYATGKEWDDVPVGGQSEKYFQLVKPALGDPCPTVTAAGGNAGLASVCHPTERRKFSIAELKRICSFPDDFVLTGSFAQQWERIGRAVPPVMMKFIAEAVRDQILLPARAAAAKRKK